MSTIFVNTADSERNHSGQLVFPQNRNLILSYLYFYDNSFQCPFKNDSLFPPLISMKDCQVSASQSSAPSTSTPLIMKIGVPAIPLEQPYFQLVLLSKSYFLVPRAVWNSDKLKAYYGY